MAPIRFADATFKSQYESLAQLTQTQAEKPPPVFVGQGSGVKNWICHNEARIIRLEKQVLFMHNELVALRAANANQG